MGRAIAALVGMDQDGINQKVYEGSIGQFRQQIPAKRMRKPRSGSRGETIERNADLRARGLVGDNTLSVNDF